MKKYYTVGHLKPLRKIELKKIEDDISVNLPKDYVIFLMTYGFGNINELLMFNSPDKDLFHSNFKDCMDLWELTNAEEKIIVKGITLAKTIDGDIILLISENKLPFVIMPRHSETPIYFNDFNGIIEFYKSEYELNDKMYFDSYDNFELKTFMNSEKKEIFNETIFDEIHKQFLNQMKFDKIIDNKQPKYILQKIGGWIYFDSIYKNSIRIKYQKQFAKEANQVIEFINDKINNHS